MELIKLMNLVLMRRRDQVTPISSSSRRRLGLRSTDIIFEIGRKFGSSGGSPGWRSREMNWRRRTSVLLR